MPVVGRFGWLNADCALRRKHSNKWSRFIRAALPCGTAGWRGQISTAHLNFQLNTLGKNSIDSIALTAKSVKSFIWIIQRRKQKPHSTHAHCEPAAFAFYWVRFVYTSRAPWAASAEIVASRKRENRSSVLNTPLPRVVFICAPGVEIWRECTLILHHFGNYFLPKRGRRKSAAARSLACLTRAKSDPGLIWMGPRASLIIVARHVTRYTFTFSATTALTHIAPIHWNIHWRVKRLISGKQHSLSAYALVCDSDSLQSINLQALSYQSNALLHRVWWHRKFCHCDVF